VKMTWATEYRAASFEIRGLKMLSGVKIIFYFRSTPPFSILSKFHSREIELEK